MREVKRSGVVLIGDVVDSRTVDDRAALHDRLRTLLTEANESYGCDLRLTVGDEYQGTMPSLGAATRVALDLRLALMPGHDVRHGLGRGSTTVLDPRAGIEDGPGWWAARAAVDAVRSLEDKPATRGVRTLHRAAEGCASPLDGALDAALLARDDLVGRLDDRSLSVLRGVLSGRAQRDVAADLGITPSAVSQRVREHGIGVVVQMTRWMEALG
jgi:hypothetical protein